MWLRCRSGGQSVDALVRCTAVSLDEVPFLVEFLDRKLMRYYLRHSRPIVVGFSPGAFGGREWALRPCSIGPLPGVSRFPWPKLCFYPILVTQKCSNIISNTPRSLVLGLRKIPLFFEFFLIFIYFSSRKIEKNSSRARKFLKI